MRFVAAVGVGVFLSIVATATTTEAAGEGEYLVLGTRRTSTLQNELSEAASRGYVILSSLASPLYVQRERESCQEVEPLDREPTVDVFDRDEDLEGCESEMIVLLERSETDRAAREVHLIAALSWKTLAQELATAGAQGYRLGSPPHGGAATVSTTMMRSVDSRAFSVHGRPSRSTGDPSDTSCSSSRRRRAA